MSAQVQDDWLSKSDHWRALAQEYYQPLSESKCYEIKQEALRVIKEHKIPEGTEGTGGFGWRDWVHLDADGLYVRFMTRKTFTNVGMDEIVDHTWSLYCDGDLLKKTHLGDNCELFHQILQQISPDMMIVQRVEMYPDLEQLTHSLALTFRVQTETGYMIVTRCIESPQLQGQLKAEGLSMSGSFIWDKFDVEHRDAQGECDEVRLTVAGSTGSDNPTYARRARDQLLKAVVRYEEHFKTTSIGSIDSSPEGNRATNDSGVMP
jgi:hypothetical protein